MADLCATIIWNGVPVERHIISGTPLELQQTIQKISIDGYVKLPSEGVAIDEECDRSIYIIPYHSILRFCVQLSDDEDCPDPHIV